MRAVFFITTLTLVACTAEQDLGTRPDAGMDSNDGSVNPELDASTQENYDASSHDAIIGPCIDRCDGNTLVRCGEQPVSCSTVHPSSTCGSVPGDTSGLAVTCLLPDGVQCLYTQGEMTYQLACAGRSPACVFDTNVWNFVCRDGYASCTNIEAGSCRRDSAVLACTSNQPLLYGCDGSLTCSDGVCRGLEEGVMCEPVFRECRDGLRCAEGSTPVCVPARDDCPAGCTTPPPNRCEYDAIDGRYTAWRYRSTGVCNSPPTNACSYPSEREVCAEDCSTGVCQPGPVCSLTEYCTPPLGCKNVSGTDFRCIPVDDRREGEPCSDEVPGYRCAEHMKCIRPSGTTTSVCGRLCESDRDCGGGGLAGRGRCVRDGTAGALGYCL